jgi:uncharacterized protein (DUF1778 family)
VVINKKQNDSKKRRSSESRKRGPIIGFRATEDERAKIQAAADRVGLTVGSYVRSRALRKPTTRAVRRPPVQTAQLAQILGLLGGVIGELKGLSTCLDHPEPALSSELSATLAEFRSVAAMTMQLLGKRAHDY